MSGKFALIIGNTEYTDPGLAQLTAPGRDAEDFARVLKDAEIGAFDSVNVLVNEQASSVIEAIDEFFDQKKPDDLLVLYFSGHGIRDEIGSLYLAFKNTIRSRLRSTAVKSDYIREAMDQSRSKRQVLVLDCCNSGAFPQGTKAELGGSMGMTKAFQGYGRFVLTASDATQFAWEGDKVIGDTDNSLFTHFLVKGLEGEADSDGDGRITVDELYDYAFREISRVTPKQTPTKSSSKQEGEIVLRQSTRIENIKPVALPHELIDEIDDTRPYVREAAVQKLEKIIKGKNIGMARSAREALEKVIADENTTRRVAQAATQVLESIRQTEKEEEERKVTEETTRLLAEQRAEEEHLVDEKAERQARAEAKLRAKQEAERLEAQKAEEERITREKAEAERKAKEKAQRLAAQKAEDERKAKEEAQRLAAQKAKEKRLAAEKTETERKAKEEAERSAVQWTEERLGRLKAKTQKEIAITQTKPAKSFGIPTGIIGMIVIALVLCGFASLSYLYGIFGGGPVQTLPPATEGPVATEAPATELPATEAPATELPATEAPATELPATEAPEGGSLQHEADDLIEANYAGVDLRDFTVTATFLNPYSPSTGSWDYGFLFRDEYGNNQYRLIITSASKWVLRNNIESTEGTIIQDGQLSNLNVSKDSSNTVWIYCQDNKGILYVNGDFVANLDLSARTNSGDVGIATGLYNGNEIAGYSTDYEGFKVRMIPLVYSPQDGSLQHEDDDRIEANHAEVDLRDFVVTATFLNPYSTTIGSWNYGFLFRDIDSSIQYRLIFISSQIWRLVVRNESSTSSTVQEGELLNLDISEGGTNTIWFYCQGDQGILYVNGEFIAFLDLSALANSGDVSIGIGFYNGSELEGHSTGYEEFSVWEIP